MSAPPRMPVVLAVDDDPAVLAVLEKTLARAGFGVQIAASGTEALETLPELLPDLVLLDIDMPGLDGLEVCSRIKKHPETRHIPVVFVTVLESDQGVARARAAGASAYVRKPFDTEVLVSVVRRNLKANPAPPKAPQGKVRSHWRDWATPPVFRAFRSHLLQKRQPGADRMGAVEAVAPGDLYDLADVLNIPKGELARFLAAYLAVPYVPRVYPSDLDEDVFPRPFCKRHLVVALQAEGEAGSVVLSNPFNWELMDVLSQTFRKEADHLRISITEPENLTALFEDAGARMILGRGAVSIDGDVDADGDHPILILANEILRAAIHERASDVHVEPKDRNTLVRFRIDGDMQDVRTLDRSMAPKLISRFKALADMDIAEKRKPQDGAMEISFGKRQFKLRLATSSTSDGESLVIRLLEPTASAVPLARLGMTGEQVATVEELGHRHQGMLIVVGPTGSGKSTTVFSLLSNVDGRSRSIMSVEDPVEYRIPFANQQQVNEKAGVTFESLLRSAMRQDPDILFLGEVRDAYSAKASMDFASSGHLTVSTLHSANATTAIFRLERLGIARGTMADSVLAFVAQKLIKKLCDSCKEVGPVSPEEAAAMAPFTDDVPQRVARPVGCPACRDTGYLGREGIYEILRFDPALAEMVRSGRAIAEIRQFARDRGDYLIPHHAIDKVRELIFCPHDVNELVLLEEKRFQARGEARAELGGDEGGAGATPGQGDDGAGDAVRSGGSAPTAPGAAVRADGRTDTRGSAAAAAQGPDTPPPSATPRILVVEDDPDTRALIQVFLTKGGFDVVAVEDGVEALLALGQIRFDAVLSDVNMPNLDGLTLLEMMCQKAIDVPAIFMTAERDDELETRIFSLGGEEFIQKPIKREVLLHRVSRVVNRARSGAVA